MPIDALTSPTLKYLRQHWWNDEFTEFLAETLRPRAGSRILDIGCGPGTGEVRIGRLHVSQLRLVGIDVKLDRVNEAKQETAAHNQRVSFAVADACHLPFRDASFDSTFCVAVLQHIRPVEQAVAEAARVTREGGRIVVVEPDNRARYFYSSASAGMRAFELSGRFFAALSAARDDGGAPDVGPRLSSLFPRSGIEPLDVRMFPVSHVRIGVQPEDFWRARRERVQQAVRNARELADGRPASQKDVLKVGDQYLTVLEAYREEALQSGTSFVEIQNTMLFATVGQKVE